MAKAQKPDLDEATIQIAKRMLSMPPKQHKDMKLGKRKKPGDANAPNAESAPMVMRGHRPSEPMVVYDIETMPDGTKVIHKPYLLKPDGSVADLMAFSK